MHYRNLALLFCIIISSVPIFSMEPNNNSTSSDAEIHKQKEMNGHRLFLEMCNQNRAFKATVFIGQYEEHIQLSQLLKDQGRNTPETDALGLKAQTELKKWQEVLQQEFDRHVLTAAPHSRVSLASIMEAAHEFAEKTL